MGRYSGDTHLIVDFEIVSISRSYLLFIIEACRHQISTKFLQYRFSNGLSIRVISNDSLLSSFDLY